MNILIKFCLLATLLAVWATTGLRANERGETLILGTVGSNPSKKSAALQPMVDYAAGKMGGVGIARGGILIAKNHDELIHALQEGKVDWITDTPFPILLIMEKTDTEILARRWKSGMSEYATLFFVPNDSDLGTLEDLRGKSVAFGDRDSTTTYYVPLSVLRARGLSPTEIATPREAPPQGQVAYILAGEQVNIFYWVQRKLVAAGVASTADWGEAREKSGNFRIIHQTKFFPRAVELVRKGLATPVKTRLREVLLGADKDPGAQNALMAYGKTKKFDAMEGDALVGMENAHDILHHIRDDL